MSVFSSILPVKYRYLTEMQQADKTLGYYIFTSIICIHMCSVLLV